MFYFIEIIVSFLSELFLGLFFQLGFRRINDVFSHPTVVAIIFGALSGFVSLLFFKHFIIHGVYLKVLNILITPIILGLIMSFIGKSYKKFDLIHSNLDNFTAGFSFAMAMALVRFIFSQ